jgi:hypothetical protein
MRRKSIKCEYVFNKKEIREELLEVLYETAKQDTIR